MFTMVHKHYLQNVVCNILCMNYCLNMACNWYLCLKAHAYDRLWFAYHSAFEINACHDIMGCN